MRTDHPPSAATTRSLVETQWDAHWNNGGVVDFSGTTDPRANECWNRDHPSFLGALGLLPGAGVDHETMRRTLRAVESHWDLRQTWGWDFPLLAMTAARLHEPDRAVDSLLHASRNFQFGVREGWRVRAEGLRPLP